MKRAGLQSGFSLVEVMISALILLGLAGVITNSMSGLSSMTVTGGIETQLQQMAERSMLRIIGDLKHSGFIVHSDIEYPYFFENGAATGDFAVHAHAPALKESQSGEYDFGANREIVLLLPLDADTDRVPDLDSGGTLLWDGRHISYVVVTDANGVNHLERRTDAGSPEKIAHHIERLSFEDAPETSFQIPLKTVRVRLYFRQRDVHGNLFRYHAEATIQLRNGGIAGDPQ